MIIASKPFYFNDYNSLIQVYLPYGTNRFYIDCPDLTVGKHGNYECNLDSYDFTAHTVIDVNSDVITLYSINPTRGIIYFYD